MAWGARMNAEWRTTGAATNGGGFSGGRGTPQLSPTDLACTVGSTTVTSATGTFTSGMTGSCLVIPGLGNWVDGQYKLTYVDAHTVTVDRSPCPGASGTAGVGTVSAGIDYSQQDSAQASGTHLASDGAGTTLTDSTASSFTAAMVGNLIYITGTGFTTGWYEVVTYIGATQVTIDRNCGASASSGTWSLGGALYALDATLVTFCNSLVAGNTVWVKNGTYTLTGTLNPSTAGTNALPILYQGFNSVHGDACNGANRPLIAGGASYQWSPSASYNQFLNFRVTATASATGALVANGTGNLIQNCYVNNLSATGTAAIWATGTGAMIVNCEAQSTAGYAFNIAAGANTRCLLCWAHDSAVGFQCTSGTPDIDSCLIEACVTGVSFSTASSADVVNCTFAHCTTGLLASGAAVYDTVLNNQFFGCKTAINWSGATNYLTNFYAYNNFFGNGTDCLYAAKGPTDTAYDPAFQGLHTWSDLACSDHSTFHLTSAAGGFGTYFQVGDGIYIAPNAGAHWTGGTFRITAVAAGQLTLATDPTDGSNASSGAGATIGVSPTVSDCRLGTSSSSLTAVVGLALGVN